MNEQPEEKQGLGDTIDAVAEKPALTPQQKAEIMHTAAQDFLNMLADRDIEAVMLPTVIAMIYNRAGQVLQIPASAIVDESVERLMAFQDIKALNEGRDPQNGTLSELAGETEKPDKSEAVKMAISNLKRGEIITPENPLLTAEGIPIANENTWANQ